eukprot:RCo048477
MPKLEGGDRSGVDWNTQVVLQSNDNVEYAVARDAAMLSLVVKDMLADVTPGEEAVIPLPQINGLTLKYVVQYVEHHINEPAERIERPLKQKLLEVISRFDREFLYTDLIKGGDERQHQLLVDCISAANFLNIEDMLDLTCAAAATMLKGKTAEQIRELCKIEDDLSPEQKAKITEENKWCEESG